MEGRQEGCLKRLQEESQSTLSPVVPTTSILSMNPMTGVSRSRDVVFDFQVLSDQIIRGETPRVVGGVGLSSHPNLASVGALPGLPLSSNISNTTTYTLGPTVVPQSGIVFPHRLDVPPPSIPSAAIPPATILPPPAPSTKLTPTVPFFDVSVPPPSVVVAQPRLNSCSISSPPPSLLANPSLSNSLLLSSPPPPLMSLSALPSIKRDQSRDESERRFDDGAQTKISSSKAVRFSENVEDIMSEEQKLKVKVIQSQLQNMQRRKENEVNKSLRKGLAVAKSKNLISLV